ncbi:N-acetyltransferase [Alkaliphilus oremlandii]|uniref:hypothetical protein n=1 Tax=Alkaliphilus oremlandii TaxID=461876 RepID=UPI0000D8315F|nr:hypothetical protein [Alkaliphilus oremlandii]
MSKEDFSNVEFWVLEDNIRARRFYEKIGFRYDNTIQIIDMGKKLRELRYIRTQNN